MKTLEHRISTQVTFWKATVNFLLITMQVSSWVLSVSTRELLLSASKAEKRAGLAKTFSKNISIQ